jgi:predicted P-loop ATPase
VKYLSRKGAKQTPVSIGAPPYLDATEGWKDAIALHLLTGRGVQGIAGVTGHRLLADTVEELFYDADAALNPGVWGPLVTAGLERPALRLGFWPAAVAGPKGGACEFRSAGGDLAAVTCHKARELLRHLPTLWDQHLRVDWKLKALRRLATLAMRAYPDNGTTQLLVVDAAKRIAVPVDAARKQLAAVAHQVDPPDREQPPEEPTKQELQRFLRRRHRLRLDDLRQVVEIDGQPMAEFDLADSFLADLYGIETTKQAAKDSFLYVAACDRFNPVREWLEALPSIPGLRLLPLQEIAAAFGIARDDSLSQELLARHLAGGYRRGMEPGYKHDQVFLMQGMQGQQKGKTIAALAPPGMADSSTKVIKGLEDREFLGKLNSCWVFEFDEIEKVLQGRDAAEFKGFVSRRNYRYVQKWETVCRDHPARALLFGTTNNREVLNDHTGNRRIWAVPVVRCDPDWVEQNRASIWATVATWVSWGLESYTPEGHPTARAAAERAQGMQITDSWEGKVREQLEALAGPERNGIALDDLARQALGVSEMERLNRDMQMRLTRLITGTGFTTHDGRFEWRQQRRRYGGGQPRSGYMPIPVPVFQPRSDDSWGGWNGQKPWENSDLHTPFQPFQPFKEGEQIERDRGVCSRMGVLSSAEEGMQRNVGTVGTPQRTPCTASDLPVPTPPGSAPVVGTALEQAPEQATPTGTQTNHELVEQALADLRLAPSLPSAVSAVYEHLTRAVPRPRVAAVLQVIAEEEREEAPSLLDP